MHFWIALPEHLTSSTAHVGCLQVASAGSQICPLGHVSLMLLLFVHECRVLLPVHTQAESGEHSTHCAGEPAHTGVGDLHCCSTQEPLVTLQVLTVLLVVHLAGEFALQPAHAPFKQYEAFAPAQRVVT